MAETSFYSYSKQYHSWDVTPAEARQIQHRLKDELCFEDTMDEPQYIAGMDVGFNADQSHTKGAVVVLDRQNLQKVDQGTAITKTRFPYIPGLLSFREAPALLIALDQLDQLPDVIICDSQGYAHPRRFGLACHIGLLTGIPTLGAAKSRLIGEHDPLPGEKGSYVPLIDDDEQVGCVLRTRTDVNPLYVSVGHKLTLSSARKWVLEATTQYKLPETTREADHLAHF